MRYLLLVILLGLPLSVDAAIDELVVFGDSLSDAGNINTITFGIVPSDAYYESRVFSNGPPWVDYLAAGLGLPIPGNSLSGSVNATNFAYGGAQTGGGSTNIGDQVEEYVASGRTLTKRSLVVLWIGGNDLNGTSASFAADQIDQTIANLDGHLEDVIALGAKQLLIPNVPLLGEVPQHNGDPDERSQQNALTMDYNDALADLVGIKRTLHPGVRFVEFDVEALMMELLTNPGAFGFTNTTGQAFTPGPLGIGGTTVPNPNEYIFWDDLHPTGPVHQLAGEEAAALLGVEEPLVIGQVVLQGPDVEVSFPSRGWECYRLECSENLRNWNVVTPEAIDGNGGILTLTHFGGAGETRAFYRVTRE